MTIFKEECTGELRWDKTRSSMPVIIDSRDGIETHKHMLPATLQVKWIVWRECDVQNPAGKKVVIAFQREHWVIETEEWRDVPVVEEV